MNKLILIVTFFAFTIVRAGCDNNMYWNIGNLGSYGESFSIKYLCDQGLNENDCNRDFTNDYISHTIKIRPKINGVWGSWIDHYSLNGYLNLNFSGQGSSWWYWEDKVKNSNYEQIRIAEELQVEVNITVDAFIGYNLLTVVFNSRQVGNLQPSENVMCWGKTYNLSQALSSFGNGMTSRKFKVYESNPTSTTVQPILNINIPDAGVFDTEFTLPEPNGVNPYYYVVFEGNRNGTPVRRKWLKEVHEVGVGYFTNSPAGLNESSPDVLLSDYSFYSGGTVEYNGNGVLNNSGWYFSSSLAGNGYHTISVRVNNQGCLSNWVDTLFQVIPIVSVVSAPTYDMIATFGVGETGANIQSNSGIVIQEFPNPPLQPVITTMGKYHAVCSNQDYQFFVQSPNASLVYEWQMVYHNQLIDLGTGVSKVISIPDRDDIIRNVFQGTNASTTDYIGNEPVSMFLNFGTPSTPIATVFTGDMIVLMLRAKNITNEYSPWRRLYLGLMPKPQLIPESVLCYLDNPVLVSGSQTSIYLDSIAQTTMRSAQWDIDGLGGFEYIGDSVYHFMTNTDKLNVFKSQIVDSTWFFVYQGGGYVEYYNEASSEVCYSSIEDINIVREPIPIVAFSEVGNVTIGTPVLTTVSGSYFNPDVDLITYQFNDGSMLYTGDSLWHYMNDLGYYSLQVTVTDQYGCYVENNYTNYWLVPGVLELLENIENNILTVYPVPVENQLTVISDEQILSIIIIDVNGSIIYSGTENILDMSSYDSGIYWVKVTTNMNVYNRKIIKL